MHVFDHVAPQEFVEVGQSCESSFQNVWIMVASFQKTYNSLEDDTKIGIEVHLQITSQLHHKTIKEQDE